MKPSRKVFLSVFFAVAATPAIAHAYIDPGFGALVWQALFAAVVGSLFFLRSTISAGFRWMRRRIAGAPVVPAAESASERPTEPG